MCPMSCAPPSPTSAATPRPCGTRERRHPSGYRQQFSGYHHHRNRSNDPYCSGSADPEPAGCGQCRAGALRHHSRRPAGGRGLPDRKYPPDLRCDAVPEDSGAGAGIRVINRHTVEIDASHIRSTRTSYELARTMPGGCNFGVRPIDQHVKGFTALGAKVVVEGGFINAQVPETGRLKGANIYWMWSPWAPP